EPEALPDGLEEHRSIAIVLWVAIGVCVFALPLGLVHVAICLGGLLGALVFGTWLAIHIAVSPWHRERRRRRTARNEARDGLDGIEQEWKQTVSRYRRVHSE